MTLSHRDQLALAAMPQAIADAHKGYNHLCQPVHARAFDLAYAFADYVEARLAEERRNRPLPPPPPPPQRGPGR